MTRLWLRAAAWGIAAAAVASLLLSVIGNLGIAAVSRSFGAVAGERFTIIAQAALVGGTAVAGAYGFRAGFRRPPESNKRQDPLT